MPNRYIRIILPLILALIAGCTSVPVTSPTALTPTPTSTPETQPLRPGEAGLSDPAFPQAGNGGYDAQHYLLDLAVNVDASGSLRPATHHWITCSTSASTTGVP